jgi:hypothetical protein
LPYVPEIYSVFIYTSSGGSSQSSPSNTLANDTNPSKVTPSVHETCGAIIGAGYSDPWCTWSTLGYSYEGKTYDSLSYAENITSFSHTQNNPALGAGNVTIDLTLELIGTSSANVTQMSVSFTPNSGSSYKVGDGFEENFGTTLYTSLSDLSSNVESESQNYSCQSPINATSCGLAQAFSAGGLVIGNFATFIKSNSLGNLNVPNLGTLVYTVQWNTGCIIDYLAAAGVTAGIVALAIADPPAAGIVLYLSVFSVTTGGIGTVYYAASACISTEYK